VILIGIVAKLKKIKESSSGLSNFDINTEPEK